MTFIEAESNRSRITFIMVVAESDWMRIQNLPNRIGCGVKKNRVRTPLVGEGKFFGEQRILARISPNLSKKILGHFFCEHFLKQVFFCNDLQKEVFM